MTGAARTAPGAGYHHGQLDRVARELAIDLVREHGVAELSMRTLAARAGVTHRALYRHFPDRAALVAAVAAHGYRLLADRIAGPAENGGAPGGSRALMRAYAGFALAEPRLHEVMMSQSAAEIRATRELADAVDRVIGLCLARMSGDPVDARDRVISVWALADGAIGLWRAGLIQASSDERLLDYLDRLVHLQHSPAGA